MKLLSGLTASILLVSTTTFAAPKNALTDYAFAQKCYYSLDKTETHGWDRCMRQFQEIISHYPNSPEAQKATFSVARITREKYRLTKDDRDLQKAFDTYNEFLKTYPKHPMADDALYQIAILRFEEQKDGEKAEKALKALLERFPQGDMAASAQAYLEKMGPPPVVSAKPDQESEEIRPQSLPKISPPPAPPDFTIRTVVIDPGHGGDDPGAIGSKGTRESEVALQISRKLAFKLKNELKLKTYLTRTKNRSLSLEGRNALANQKGADLFISIHANANGSPKAAGVQTFYLNNATNEASKRLANRENKADGKRADLSQKILSTMLQNANTEESRDLAHAVQKSLVQRLKKTHPPIKDLKVDSALFYVLVGSKSPGILVETSFITNPNEEKRLKDSAYQWAIAEGVAKGVKKYIDSRQKLASSL